jgi:glycosyltransferase involved in cell wall biosynthesis
VALLKGSDIVVVLTTNNDTMQNGALEALELERPIITSDWPVLREAFYKGTIYIDNTAAGLVRAIEQIRNNYSYYLNEIKILREELHAGWAERLAKLLLTIEN